MIEEKGSLKESVVKKKERKKKISCLEFKSKKRRNVSSLRPKKCLEFKTNKKEERATSRVRDQKNCIEFETKKCLEFKTNKKKKGQRLEIETK